MNGKVLRFDDSTHQAVNELLPWFVNGTLDEQDQTRVIRHLRDCTRCRSEIEALREVQAFFATERRAANARRGHGASRRRIPRRPVFELLGAWLRLLEQWRAVSRRTRWAVPAQCAALLAFVLLLVSVPIEESPAVYRTLGSSARNAGPGTIAVVFAPDVREAEIHRIVRRVGARIVDGPTVSNAYVLELRNGREAESLQAMRSEPAVVFMETLSARADR